MIDASGESYKESSVIEITEKEEDLVLFLAVLGVYGFEMIFPPELQDLKPKQLVSLLQLADKYNAL